MTAHRDALTARRVASLAAPGRYADGRGLYLLIGPTGAKSWLLRVQVKHGRRVDMGLGSVALVSLQEARERALTWRKAARAGQSPVALRRDEAAAQQARANAPTFEAAAHHVHAYHSPSFKNDKHRRQWLSSLAPILRALGEKRVHDITSADLTSALEPRWLAHPETSRRVLQRIRLIFEWTVAKHYRRDDPTRNLERVFPKRSKASKTHHAALKYDALPTFVEALRRTGGHSLTKLAFEFLILTATRTSETLGARWDEMDQATATWTIPGARMKAGVEHRVPLSRRALAILAEAQSLGDGSPFVFPGRRPAAPLSNMAFLMTLRRMGRTDITPHGFRSTFRDWTEEKTHTPRAVAEAALAHTVRDKVEAAYRRTDLFEKRRELMQQWAQFATTQHAAMV